MEEELVRLGKLLAGCLILVISCYFAKLVIRKQWPSNARWIHYLDILFYVLCWFASGGLIGMYLDFLCVYVCDQVHDVYTVYVVQQVVSVWVSVPHSLDDAPFLGEMAFDSILCLLWAYSARPIA